MALTYRSSTPEEMFLYERLNGSGRAVTATVDPDCRTNGTLGGETWRLEISHPNGWSKTASVFGDRNDAFLAMATLMNETRTQFRAEIRDGHRQPVELNPMRNSVALPTAPVVSMGKNSR